MYASRPSLKKLCSISKNFQKLEREEHLQKTGIFAFKKDQIFV